MQTLEQANRHLAGLHWLAYLLTGSHEESAEVAIESVDSYDEDNPYFSGWMEAWSRRIVMAKALAAIRGELAVSRDRMKSARMDRPVLPRRDWTLQKAAGKAEIEKALLAIDVFPRAALVLTVFEGVAIADAAVLLDGTPEEIQKARAIAAQQLTNNLACPHSRNCQKAAMLIRQWAY